MLQKLFSSKLLVLMNVVLISLMGVTLVSAHGGNTALIHSCVSNGSGEIKIVGANVNCPSNYRPIDRNNQGPAGVVGPSGSQGLQGLQGIQGPAGISGLEVVTADNGFQAAAMIDITADCPDGKQVIGGGFSIRSAEAGDLNVRVSAPIASNRWGYQCFRLISPMLFQIGR